MTSISPAVTSARLRGLDDIKSSLVVFMFLFHAASGLTLYQRELEPLMSGIYFIHFAFLFVSGLLSGIHYVPDGNRNMADIQKRLLVRGGKLLGIFGICNLLVLSGRPQLLQQLLQSGNEDGWWRLFLCNMNGSLFSFEILYYIGIFFLVAGIIFFILNDWNALLLGAGAMLIPGNNVVFCCAFGLIGLGVGKLYLRWRSEEVLWKAMRIFSRYGILLLLLKWYCFGSQPRLDFAYRFWLVAETGIWFVVSIQLLELCRLRSIVTIFGRYTLAAYLGQMAVFWGFSRIVMSLHLSAWPAYVVNLLVTAAAVYGALWLLDALRKRKKWIDRCYRLVFC